MVELSLARRLAIYLTAIFAVWFVFLGGGWHLFSPSSYDIQDALLLFLPTLVLPLAIGFLGSLALFPRVWESERGYRTHLIVIAVAAVVLTSFYVYYWEHGVRLGMLFEQEKLYRQQHGGFVTMMLPPGGGYDRSLFIGVMSALIAATEIRRRKGAAGRNGGVHTSESPLRYHLPFEFWVLLVPAASRIWEPYFSTWGTNSLVDAAVWEPFLRSHDLGFVLNLLLAAVFAVWYFRLRKTCRQEHLLLSRSEMSWMSGDEAIGRAAWEDVQALSHLRMKPVRFLRVVSADGSHSIPASCVDTPAELVAQIRQRAGLTEEHRSLLWVRYERAETIMDVAGVFHEAARGKSTDWDQIREETMKRVGEEVVCEDRG